MNFRLKKLRPIFEIKLGLTNFNQEYQFIYFYPDIDITWVSVGKIRPIL